MQRNHIRMAKIVNVVGLSRTQKYPNYSVTMSWDRDCCVYRTVIKEDIEDYEKRCEDEIHSRWEEEEQRYWENEGYRSAFEDDPEAEWNID